MILDFRFSDFALAVEYRVSNIEKSRIEKSRIEGNARSGEESGRPVEYR